MALQQMSYLVIPIARNLIAAQTLLDDVKLVTPTGNPDGRRDDRADQSAAAADHCLPERVARSHQRIRSDAADGRSPARRHGVPRRPSTAAR